MIVRPLREVVHLLAFAALILLFPTSHPHASDFLNSFSLTPRPRPVPAFTFQDESGQPVTLKDFQGRFVLLNLWATWCATCVSEMPSLESLQHRFDPSRFQVVALSVDRSGLAAVRSFYRRHGISGLSPYLDPDSLSLDALDARFLPTTLLIDPEGREIGRIKGGMNWAAEEVVRFIEDRVHGD